MKEIIALAMFGYLILISIDNFSVSFLVLLSIEKIYQTLKAVFNHTFKHVEFRQKNSAARRILNSLLGVWR